MIYSIGIDLGLRGAIALIAPYLRDSIVIPTPKAEKWLCPVEEQGSKKSKGKEKAVFRDKGKNKGDRIYSQHPSWGGNLLRHESIVEAVRSAGLSMDTLCAVQSYLENPGAQGGTRAGFDNSKTVGMNTYPWILAMEQLTCRQPWRVSVREWQSHPAIATWGKVDYTHGAKDKSEGKKHQAIALANELFDKDISFTKKGDDGMADALLIGLYGALKYPPVLRMGAIEAWNVLNHEQANYLSAPTDLPFTEALIYADDISVEDYQWASNSLSCGGSQVPPMEKLRSGGIVGYVTLGDRQQLITSRVVYPDVTEFDMNGRAIAPYYNQLPHLIV